MTRLLFAIAIVLSNEPKTTYANSIPVPPVGIEPTTDATARQTLARKSITTGFSGRIDWHMTPNPNGALYAPAYRDNMMTGLRSGNRATIGTGPTMYTPLPDGAVVTSREITITPYNLDGFQPEAGLYLTSPTKFSLSEISFEFESIADRSTGKPLGELGLRGSFATNNYSITREGWDWGPDNLPNTADDRFFTSGSGTIRVNGLRYRGISNWFEERTLADTQQKLVDTYIASKQPYTIRATYTVANQGTVTSTLRVVPVTSPPPAPAFTIVPRITLVPSGSIAPGTQLRVTIDDVNNGSGNYVGSVTNVVQVRRSFAGSNVVISDWADWSAPGTSVTANLATGETKPVLSYVWNADGADGILYELRAVESDASGQHISGTVSVQVVSAQPSPAAFKLAVSLTPTGTVVTGGALQLIATVSNVGGSAYFGTVTFRAQSSTDGGTNWTTWAEAGQGVVTGLGVGETKTAFSFPWKADGVDNKTYQFRVVGVTSDNQSLESGSTPTVVVVPGATPIVLGIAKGSSVNVSFVAPSSGTYDLEKSEDLRTWVNAETVTVQSGGSVTRTFPIVGRQGFWRVRRL